jgi:hypothetical protein
MPAGPGALGFVYFAAAKLVGYTAYCRWAIQPHLLDSDEVLPPIPSALKAGAARAIIGIGIGVTLGLGFWNIPWFSQHDVFAEPLFFSVLVPIRIFEWWLLLRWIYGNFALRKTQRNGLIAGGIVVSFALDAIGVFAAWVLPGGMWVC